MTKKEMLGQMEELKSTCVDICTNLQSQILRDEEAHGSYPLTSAHSRQSQDYSIN